MTRTKHPHSREERLKIKNEKKELQAEKKLASKVRRRYKEELKDKETQDELLTNS